MTQTDEIKTLLYDIERAKGDFGTINDLLLNFRNHALGFELLTEFIITDDVDNIDDYEKHINDTVDKLNDTVDKLEKQGEIPSMIKISIYKDE